MGPAFALIGPTWSGEGAPSGWGVAGPSCSGLEGEIVGWWDDEEYRPSPRSWGWRDPVGAVDAAVRLAAAGSGWGVGSVVCGLGGFVVWVAGGLV